MKIRALLTVATAAVGLVMGISSAHAVTIDGITMPEGVSTSGTQLQSSTLEETLITGTGQTLQGIGFISSISQGLNTTWSTGQNGVQLLVVFGDSAASNNFVSNSVTAPVPGTSDGSITFSGGNAQYYVVPNSVALGSLIGTGNIQTDISNIKGASTALWLNAVAAPLDSSGNTLQATIPNSGTLLNFSNAFGSAFFDVVTTARANDNTTLGVGDADYALATSGLVNPYDQYTCRETTGTCSDAFFTESFSTGSTDPGYQVSGTASVKANAVPEPTTLSILGASLLAFGFISRKRNKA